MPVRVCTGLEFGLSNATSLTKGNTGNKLFDVLSGTPAITIGAARSGTYGLEISQSAAVENLGWDTSGGTIPASQDFLVFSFWFKFPTSLPTADVVIANIWTLGGDVNFQFRNSDDALLLVDETSATTSVGPSVVANTWYHVEIKVDADVGDTYWYVDGVAQTQNAATPAATTIVGVFLGGETSQTMTCYYDDVVVWTDSSNISTFPFGPQKVVLLKPDTGGSTAQIGTANATGRMVTNSAINATHVSADILAATSEVPPLIGATATGVGQRTSGSGNAVGIPMTTYTLQAGENFTGVRFLVCGWAASATTNNIGLRVFNGNFEDILFATADPNFDNNTTSPAWLCKMDVNNRFSVQGNVDAMVVRIGYATDISPLPGAHAIYAELAVTEAAGAADQDITPGAVTVSVTPGSLTVRREEQIVPAPVTVTVTPGTVTVRREEAVTPAPVTVAVTPGSLTVAREEQITPAPVTVAVTPGSLAVMQAPVYRGHATTMIGGAGATAIDAAVPAGTADTELLVAVVSWRGIGTIAATDGSWTERHDFQDTVGPQFAVYTRVAGASEPATYNFTFSGSASRVVAVLVRFSDHSGVEDSQEVSGNSTSPTAPSATAVAAGRLALFLWAHSHFPFFTFPSGEQVFVWQENTFGAETGAVGQHGAIEVVGSGATGTRVGTFDIAREWRGVTVIVAPAVGAQAVAPAPVTVTVTPGSLAVAREEQVVPAPVTISVTPGSLGVAREEQVVPAPVTVTVTPGSLAVAREEQVVPAPVSVAVTPGSLTITPPEAAITPAPVTISVTPGSLVVTPPPQDVVPAPVTITATAGSLTVTPPSQGVTPAPVVIDVTAGSLAVTTGPVAVVPDSVTVSVTPGSLVVTLAQSVNLVGPTVSVTPGGLTVRREEAVAPAPVSVTVTPGSLLVAVDQAVVPAPVSVTVTPGSLTVFVEQAVAPAPVIVTVGAGSLVITTGPVNVVPDPATVSVTPGELVVVQGQPISLDGPVVSVNAGSLTITTGPVDVSPAAVVVTVTPGALTIAPPNAPVTPAPVTVVATPGELTVTGLGGPQSVTPAPVSVTMTPGSLLVALDQGIDMTAPAISMTPGSLTIAVGDVGVTPAPATVTVTPGLLTVTGGVFSVEDSEWDAELSPSRWTANTVEANQWAAQLGSQRWDAELDDTAIWWDG